MKGSLFRIISAIVLVCFLLTSMPIEPLYALSKPLASSAANLDDKIMKGWNSCARLEAIQNAYSEGPVAKSGQRVKGTFAGSSLDEVLEILKKIGVAGKKFIDLGSGDGRVALLAWVLGADAVGIEFEGDLHAISLKKREIVLESYKGREDEIKFMRGNFLEERTLDLGDYDIVFYALSGASNEDRLQEKLLKELNPGAIFIAYNNYMPRFPLGLFLRLDRVAKYCGLGNLAVVYENLLYGADEPHGKQEAVHSVLVEVFDTHGEILNFLLDIKAGDEKPVILNFDAHEDRWPMRLWKIYIWLCKIFPWLRWEEGTWVNHAQDRGYEVVQMFRVDWSKDIVDKLKKAKNGVTISIDLDYFSLMAEYHLDYGAIEEELKRIKKLFDDNGIAITKVLVSRSEGWLNEEATAAYADNLVENIKRVLIKNEPCMPAKGGVRQVIAEKPAEPARWRPFIPESILMPNPREIRPVGERPAADEPRPVRYGAGAAWRNDGAFFAGLYKQLELQDELEAYIGADWQLDFEFVKALKDSVYESIAEFNLGGHIEEIEKQFSNEVKELIGEDVEFKEELLTGWRYFDIFIYVSYKLASRHIENKEFMEEFCLSVGRKLYGHIKEKTGLSMPEGLSEEEKIEYIKRASNSILEYLRNAGYYSRASMAFDKFNKASLENDAASVTYHMECPVPIAGCIRLFEEEGFAPHPSTNIFKAFLSEFNINVFEFEKKFDPTIFKVDDITEEWPLRLLPGNGLKSAVTEKTLGAEQVLALGGFIDYLADENVKFCQTAELSKDRHAPYVERLRRHTLKAFRAVRKEEGRPVKIVIDGAVNLVDVPIMELLDEDVEIVFKDLDIEGMRSARGGIESQLKEKGLDADKIKMLIAKITIEQEDLTGLLGKLLILVNPILDRSRNVKQAKRDIIEAVGKFDFTITPHSEEADFVMSRLAGQLGTGFADYLSYRMKEKFKLRKDAKDDDDWMDFASRLNDRFAASYMQRLSAITNKGGIVYLYSVVSDGAKICYKLSGECKEPYTKDDDEFLATLLRDTKFISSGANSIFSDPRNKDVGGRILALLKGLTGKCFTDNQDLMSFVSADNWRVVSSHVEYMPAGIISGAYEFDIERTQKAQILILMNKSDLKAQLEMSGIEREDGEKILANVDAVIEILKSQDGKTEKQRRLAGILGYNYTGKIGKYLSLALRTLEEIGIQALEGHKAPERAKAESTVTGPLRYGVGAAWRGDGAFGANEPRPFILTKEPQRDATFNKGGQSILFGRTSLNRLYDMTMLAWRLGIELEAACFIKDGKVIRVYYPDDADKIAVVKTDLPSSVYMNDSEFYSQVSYYLKNIRWAISPDYAFDPDRRDQAIKYLDDLRRHLIRYQTYINMYSVSRQERIIIDSAYIGDLIKTIEGKTCEEIPQLPFFKDILSLEAVATVWWSPNLLIARSSISPTEDGYDRVATVHNHPKGYPSPPSDSDMKAMFHGEITGNILDTQEGPQMLLFYEPDDANKGPYRELFRNFWNGPKKTADVLAGLRNLAMQTQISKGISDEARPGPFRQNTPVTLLEAQI